MAYRAYYEWNAEEWDEYDDILDHDHADKLETLKLHHKGDSTRHIVLIKDIWCPIEEDLKSRAYAYVENGELPENFDDGSKVPQRFINEFNKVWK